MSKSIPKNIKKGNKKNYSKMAQLLKGKVNFKIDLRKTDKNPSIKSGKDTFNFGEKMKLLRAFKEFRQFAKSANYISLPKLKNESKSAYKKRVNLAKKDYGQGGNHFNGVWVDTPAYAKISKKVIKGRTQFETSVFVKRIPLEVGFGRLFRKEIYVPVSAHELMSNTKEVMRNLRKNYPNYDYIQPVHSGYRGNGFGMDMIEDMGKRIMKWIYSGSGDSGHWDIGKLERAISGFILGRYTIQREKGSKGNPVMSENLRPAKTDRRKTKRRGK